MVPIHPDDDLATLSEQSQTNLVGERAPLLPALVAVWLADEPARSGEVCLLPVDDPWGPLRVFGRGETRSDDPHRRVHLLRQISGGTQTTPPLSNRHVSRVQLLLKGKRSGAISVENAGRCHAYKNGERFESTLLEPGDVLRLGQQLLFLCALRPAWAPSSSGVQVREFGRADGHGLVGESPCLWELRRSIAAAAAEQSHVLLLGETGTGKELVARAIHAESPSGQRPLIARNAATLPEGLIDAELFGSSRNYPNAGMPDRPGLIGQAHGSTLFLDEFGELSRALQVHLLRVLDDGEYQRLGEAVPRRSTFRLIAATNQPVDALREDVLARFKTRIVVPPLRERPEDVPLLLRHELEKRGLDAATVPIGLIELLLRHDCTGNVRELQALALRYCQDPRFEEWTDVWREARAETASRVDPLRLSREDVESCLKEHDWVQEKAWRALGLSSRHALARLMRKYGIEQPPQR